MAKPSGDKPIPNFISYNEVRAMMSEESRQECDAITRMKAAIKPRNLEALRSCDSLMLWGGLTEKDADPIKSILRTFSFSSEDHDIQYDFSRGIIRLGSMELLWTLDCLDSEVLEARLNSELTGLSVMPLNRLRSK